MVRLAHHERVSRTSEALLSPPAQGWDSPCPGMRFVVLAIMGRYMVVLGEIGPMGPSGRTRHRE